MNSIVNWRVHSFKRFSLFFIEEMSEIGETSDRKYKEFEGQIF